MKKITYLLVLIPFLSFAQEEVFSTEKIAEAEMKSASKMKDFRINPNTQNYDVTYSKLEFTIDPAVYNIVGKVTTTFKALSDMSTVTFDLYKKNSNPFTISSVKIDGANAAFVYNSTHELVITLPSTLTVGNSAIAEISYSGAPSTAQQAFTRGSHGSPAKSVIYTLSEPYGARDWWPCKQDLNDKIDSIDVYITSPSEYLSASNGLEMSRNIVGANATTHFKHNYPIPAYLVAVAVTNYVKKNTGTAGLIATFPIVDYLYPESDTPANAINLARTSPIINFFESKIGPYPFNLEKYGHTQWGWGGGMEHSTNSFMISFGRGLLSHELAHQWFGDKITCGSWKDIWLNEGITEYMSGTVVENFDVPTNPAAFINWKANKINSITSTIDGNVYLYDSQLTDVDRIFSSQITYNKGSMVTHMLRYIMGDVNFFQALRNYLSDPMLAYKYAVTPQFQAHLEAVHGSSLQEFFEDWVYNEGYPTYSITAYNSGVNQARVTINQTQSITDSGYIGYVSYFEMPVPVRLNLSNGSDLDVKLTNTFSGQGFDVDLPAGTTLTGIVFDPNSDIISANSNAVLGTNNFELAAAINLFPNPSKDKITLELPSLINLEKVSFVNLLGQKVMTAITNQIDVSALATGVYQLLIETNEGQAHKKFIKK
ncbi:MAG: M1 family aminopeptidase [Bacteroidota bacterium]